MANWKKLAVSGSATAFPQLKVDTSITASIFSGSQFIGALTGTASYASNADRAISSSYALSASYAPGSDTAVSASYALSSSYALNASTANSATSASYALSSSYSNFALTASYVIDKTIVTGSNATFTQPTPATTWVFNHMLNDQFPVFQVFNASNQVIIPTSITADSNVTATITFSVPTAGTAVASIGGFTGSAPTVFSASYALSSSYALTASYALNVPDTASFAISASYALSSSYALSASCAISALTASYVETAQTASYVLNAVSASRAISAANADNATSASFAASGNGTFSGSFSGSFQGNGAGLTNVPASGIVGLNLSQIASGSATASISPDLGFTVNTNSQITGSLIVSSNINSAGNVVATGANSSLTGSFTGSFAGNFVGTSNLPDLTQGTGISAFTYDGSTTATVAVSGAAQLVGNTITKWNSVDGKFVTSSITEISNVTINNPGGVLVQAGGLYVTGASTFHDNVVMQANLTVNGTASFQNVQNLAVVDQFILLNSGSTTFQDSGIVINTGNSANSGSAFFLETAGTTTGTNALNGRFAVASGVLPDATSATAAEYAVTALISGSTPGNAVPQFGGTGLGQGNMWIDSTTGELYIYM
jgi:hypothetical protein